MIFKGKWTGFKVNNGKKRKDLSTLIISQKVIGIKLTKNEACNKDVVLIL